MSSTNMFGVELLVKIRLQNLPCSKYIAISVQKITPSQTKAPIDIDLYLHTYVFLNYY